MHFVGPLGQLWPALDAAEFRRLVVPRGVRLPVPPASDRSAWPGTVDPAALATLVAQADAEAAAPWPQPRASGAARFHRDGNRTAWEAAAFARTERLSRAVVAAAAEPTGARLDAVVDGVVAPCEQSSWSWPAHDDAFARRGWVLPDLASPYLDLGAGEIVGQLGWIDHLLGPELDAHAPGLRARMRHEAALRAFAPFENRRDWHWLGLDGDVHNWNPWIHGNLLVGALTLVDEDADVARLLALIVEGLDRYVAALPADGAIDEGYSYWWNGACRALEALELLAHATGGVLDAAREVPALRGTVAFPHRMQLGGPWFLNVADGSARPSDDLAWDALHRAARAVGNADAAAFAAGHRAHPDAPGSPNSPNPPNSPVGTAPPPPGPERGLGRLLRALTDADWLAAGPGSDPLPATTWLPSVQILLARRDAGSTSGLTLAIKGGHNAEHHNHNDVGSMVVALDGVPVVVDPGRPTYTAQTFGPDRYDLPVMQSAWHSTPTIRGTAQRAGREFAARAVEVDLDPRRPCLSLDVAGAYPRDDVLFWVRRATLDRDTGCVQVSEAWEFTGSDPAQSVVHVIVAGDVTVVDERTVDVMAVAGPGGVRITADQGRFATTVWELDDPMLTDVWGERLTRLDLAVDATRGRLVWRIEALPRHDAPPRKDHR